MKRTGYQGGDPAKSKELYLRFTRWCGKRSFTEAINDAGLEPKNAKRWIAHVSILSDANQSMLESVLSEEAE